MKFLEFSDMSRTDYPSSAYRVFWELRINPETFEWGVRLISHDNGKEYDETVGRSQSEQEALAAMRGWVLARIERYKRG